MRDFQIATHARVEFVDITPKILEAVRASKVAEGICIVYCPHTTAAITINENADPDVLRDLDVGLERMVPRRGDYAHREGNSDAHLKASLLGPSQTLIVSRGQLLLGTWQGVFFCEFDGPRERRFQVRILSEPAEQRP